MSLAISLTRRIWPRTPLPPTFSNSLPWQEGFGPSTAHTEQVSLESQSSEGLERRLSIRGQTSLGRNLSSALPACCTNSLAPTLCDCVCVWGGCWATTCSAGVKAGLEPWLDP